MSRIGEKKILIPDGVTVTDNNNIITVKGPKGQLEYNLQNEINVSIDSNLVTVNRQSDKKTVKQLHGTVRSLLDNMITGVSKGFEKKLEVRGVGYRAKIEGKNLILNIGKSHDVKYTVPDDITVVVAENTKLTVCRQPPSFLMLKSR